MIKILDFYGSWCTPCKQLQPILTEIAREKDVEIVPVDVEKEPDTANQYGIRGIPALIFLQDGEVASRLDGIHTKEEILDVLRDLGV